MATAFQDALRDYTQGNTLDETQLTIQSALGPARKEQGYFSGGAIERFADVLNFGNFVQTALFTKMLESQGVLKKTDKSFWETVKEKQFNEELLTNIGNATSGGGVWTGQYRASQNVWSNFLREIPRVTLGLAVDIFLDPLFFLSKLGVPSKTFSIAKRATASRVKAFEKRIGKQPITFMAKKILRPSQFLPDDIKEGFARIKAKESREISELAAESVNDLQKLSKASRLRVQQIMLGGVTNDAELKSIAAKLKNAIDFESSSISKQDPSILNPETYVRGLDFSKSFFAPTIKVFSKGLEPLAIEIRKFKTVDEFINKGITAKNITLKQSEFAPFAERFNFEPGRVALTPTRAKDISRISVFHGTDSPNAFEIINKGKIIPRVSRLDPIGEKAISLSRNKNVSSAFGGVVFEIDKTKVVVREAPKAATKGDIFTGFEVRTSKEILLKDIKVVHILADGGKGLKEPIQIIETIDRFGNTRMKTIGTYGDLVREFSKKGVKVEIHMEKSQLTDFFNQATKIPTTAEGIVIPASYKSLAQEAKGFKTSSEYIDFIKKAPDKEVHILAAHPSVKDFWNVSKISEIRHEAGRGVRSIRGDVSSNYVGKYFASKLFPNDTAPLILGKTKIKVSMARFTARKDFTKKMPGTVLRSVESKDKALIQQLAKSDVIEDALQEKGGYLFTRLETKEVLEDVFSAFENIPGVTKTMVRDAIRVRSYTNRINSEFFSKSDKPLSLLTIDEMFAQVSSVKLKRFFNNKVRDALGEIKDGSLTGLRTTVDLIESKNKLELFTLLAKNKEHVSKFARAEWADKIPNTKSFGALRNMWVSPELGQMLKREFRHLEGVDAFFLKGLVLWKLFKTAYNPSTIARNDITNMFFLNPMGGLPFWRADVYYNSMKEYKRQGPIMKEFMSLYSGKSSFVGAELRKKTDRLWKIDLKESKNISKFYDKSEDFHNAVVDFYGAQDKFFKFANFYHHTQNKGLDKWAAYQKANFYLIDYSDVPNAVDFLRRSPLGIPFIAFTYGVSYPLAATLVNNPDQLANFFKVLNAIRALNPNHIPQETRDLNKDVLPDFMRNKPLVELPYKGPNNTLLFLDVEYILPFNVFEVGSFKPSSPVFDIMASLITNVDTFTKREIVPDGTGRLEATGIVTNYIYRKIAPSLAPGGFGYDSMLNAIKNQPERLSETPRSVTSAFFKNFAGINTIQIDPSVSSRRNYNARLRKIQEIKIQMSQVRRDKFIDADEKDRLFLKLRKKLLEEIQNRTPVIPRQGGARLEL